VAETVPELCMALALAFKEGRLDRLSEHYVYPLAIYSPSGLWIEANPRETADIVFLRRALAVKAGMADLRVAVGTIKELAGGRIKVGVSWEYLDAVGRTLGRSKLNYYCRRGEDAVLRVEMIDFSELAFWDGGRPAVPPARRN